MHKKLSLSLIALLTILYAPNQAYSEGNLTLSMQAEENTSNQQKALQLNKYGDNFFNQNNYYKAMECYKNALAFDNSLKPIYYNLALTQKKIGERESAIKNIDTYLKNYPNEPKGIALKRVLSGTSAAYQGPLTVFLIQYNRNGVGYFDLYNTSNQDVSIILFHPGMKIITPHGTARMGTQGSTLGPVGYIASSACIQGNMDSNTIINAHNKLRVNFTGLNNLDKEIINGLNEADLEQTFLDIPLAYRNGTVGPGTIWNAQVSVINK
jgi:tetratricopeptide (TPR) repeat protein